MKFNVMPMNLKSGWTKLICGNDKSFCSLFFVRCLLVQLAKRYHSWRSALIVTSPTKTTSSWFLTLCRGLKKPYSGCITQYHLYNWLVFLGGSTFRFEKRPCFSGDHSSCIVIIQNFFDGPYSWSKSDFFSHDIFRDFGSWTWFERIHFFAAASSWGAADWFLDCKGRHLDIDNKVGLRWQDFFGVLLD